MSAEQIYTIAILLVVITIVATFLRPKYPLRIVMKGGRVESHHGVAKAQVNRVVHFLEHDVALDGNVIVCGVRDSQGVLRVHFKGRINQGTAQQIRNYLKLVL